MITLWAVKEDIIDAEITSGFILAGFWFFVWNQIGKLEDRLEAKKP